MWEIACCTFIFMMILLVVTYLVFRVKEGPKSSKKCPECGGPMSYWSGECQWCGRNLETESSGRYDTSYGKKKTDLFKKDWMFGLFRKKNVCPDCGRELIYRKEYQSWYCTECHSYQ